MTTGTARYQRKNLWWPNDPAVLSNAMRYTRNNALEASNAPVSRARISPECLGKAFESWNDEMYVKGPPRARNR